MLKIQKYTLRELTESEADSVAGGTYWPTETDTTNTTFTTATTLACTTGPITTTTWTS